MSFRDKLAEVMVMIAVEWVATPAWRRSYHQADADIEVLTYGQPGKGTSQWVGPRSEPETIEDYQRHLVAMHGVPEDDEGLEPWCGACGERIESAGQDCMVDEGPCRPDVMDLAAMHADAHDDNECYPDHEHGA